MSVEGQEPSPLAAMVETLKLIANNRKLLEAFGNECSGGPYGVHTWRTFGEDLEMMFTERMVIGLRLSWVRRVAIPVLHAYKTLQGSPDKAMALKAIEIMGQCVDAYVRDKCIAWIKTEYGV